MKPTYNHLRRHLQNRFMHVLGASFISLLAVSASIAAEFSMPDYEKLVLDNGLTVYLLKQDEVPLVNMMLVTKAGAVYDAKSGLAKISADNLLLGTKDLSRAELEETFEFVGARVSSSANSDYSSVFISIAKKDTGSLFPLFRDALLMPRFDEQEFADQKTRYIANLQQAQTSPRDMLGEYVNAVMYKGHPYANGVKGTVTSVEGIALHDVMDFHQTYYRPNNSAIIVTGDINIDDMKKQIRTLFGDWKASKAALPVIDDYQAEFDKPEVWLINKDDATESTFVLGGPGIKRSNPNFVSLSVINTILGARFTSWLNDELRVNSGLTYRAGSRFDANAVSGSFVMSTFTRNQTTEETIDLALKTYTRLFENGIDKATLDSAKAYVKGRFAPRYETSGNLASLLGDMFIYGFDDAFINTFNRQVDGLTLAKSKTLIKQYFPKDNLQLIIVGKAEKIGETLSKYGNVNRTDIKSPEIAF